MTLPTKFRTSSEKILQSFNFTDVAAGTAYKTTYGVGTDSNTYLSSTAIESDTDNYRTDFTAADGAVVKLGELNFDLTFDNRSQVVQGVMLINSTILVSIGGGGTTGTGQFKFRVLHVDSADTETEVAAQVATAQKTNPSAGTSASWRFLTEITIPQKRFKDGEKLRLEVEVWGARAGGASSVNIRLNHDGANRANEVQPQVFTTIGTDLIVQVPFKVAR